MRRSTQVLISIRRIPTHLSKYLILALTLRLQCHSIPHYQLKTNKDRRHQTYIKAVLGITGAKSASKSATKPSSNGIRVPKCLEQLCSLSTFKKTLITALQCKWSFWVISARTTCRNCMSKRRCHSRLAHSFAFQYPEAAGGASRMHSYVGRGK